MSREDYVAVATRLFSIYVFFNIARSVPGAIQILGQDQGMAMAGLYAFILFVGILFCAFLWFFPLTVARKLLPVMREPRSEDTIGSATALSIGMTLIGIWFLGNALVDFSYWLSLFVRTKQVGDIIVEWPPNDIASVVATAVQLIVATWLLFGSSGIKRLIFRFRFGVADGAP